MTETPAITPAYMPPIPSCNPLCERRLDDLEEWRRSTERDETIRELWTVVRKLEQGVANLNGRLAGYLFAGGLIGTIVGALAAILAGQSVK